MDIRAERHTDEDGVRALHHAAFGTDGRKVADLVDDLRALLGPGRGVSLVALDAGQVRGHVLLTPALLDAPPRLVEVQVLSPLGVLPEHHREGIGSALVRRGLQVVADQGAPVVFLEGDPGYYARFGFTAGHQQGFRSPSLRIPALAFQARRLPSWAPWMTGSLVYPEAFWRHDAVGLRDPGA